jgi:DNA-binding NtrC family response regulator
MKANVLIVDDDAALRRALADRFRFWGHAAREAKDGEEALAAARREEFDLVLLDLAMPGLSGMDVLDGLAKEHCGADVVVLTAQGTVERAVEALKRGASDFLLTPADFELLRSVVERALTRRRLEKTKEALADARAAATRFVAGESPAMKAIVDTAARAAQSNATILLTGESGTGKQVFAELIHRQSARRDGPFVYVNCVALSDELIESTLFGHERGAFTGAVAQKQGRLEAAAGGTAFLDEVGDVTPSLQTKLLHFLETGECERVGGTRTLRIDCRVIAATNKDLPSAIAEGRFREDLYYRLNVIHLRVPALRDRPEDIPALAQAFLDRYAAELRRGPIHFTARTAELMARYPWPGNIRQLKNAVERMVVLAQGDTLTPDLLPPEVFAGGEKPRSERADRPLREAVHQFKKDYIARVLAEAGGNQTRAAEILGIQRTFLNRLIKELGL